MELEITPQPFYIGGVNVGQSVVVAWFVTALLIILAIVVGLVCAGIEIARIPVLRQVVRVYIELSRNTPLLVQLYFLYFGLPKLGLVWSAELCAIVGLGFLGGSYMAEAMRGGLETIPEVQRESAYVLGLSKWQTLSRVVIPQAISTSIPGVVANVIFLIKESSVVSAIALADVMYMAKDLIGMYYDTYESLFLLIVAYLVILLPISLFGTWLERRFDYERLADDDEKSRCAGADQDLSGFHPHHATAGAAVHRLLRFRAGMELEFGCDWRMRVRLRFVGRR